jgi:hypothetical protein
MRSNWLARERGDCRHLRAEQAPLRLQRWIRPADVQSARRHLEIGGQHRLHTRRIAVDGCGTLDGLGDRLEADPAAGETRQREAEQAEVEIILQRRRVDDRHHRSGKDLLALVRQG